jgi:hypothetical protein
MNYPTTPQVIALVFQIASLIFLFMACWNLRK